MTRKELEAFIAETYGAEADYPWTDAPNYAVFRHGGNRKWFAVIMDIPGSRLGRQSQEMLDVVNLKCDPILIGALCCEPGFFPAYHMNKEHWITAALDASAADDRIRMLVDMSYDLTAPRIRAPRQGGAGGSMKD